MLSLGAPLFVEQPIARCTLLGVHPILRASRREGIGIVTEEHMVHDRRDTLGPSLEQVMVEIRGAA